MGNFLSNQMSILADLPTNPNKIDPPSPLIKIEQIPPLQKNPIHYLQQLKKEKKFWSVWMFPLQELNKYQVKFTFPTISQ